MASHQLTGSRLYLAEACPTSHTLPWVESSSEAAERGTALHSYLATGTDTHPDCAALDVAAIVPPSSGIDDREVAFAWDAVAGTARRLDNLGRDYQVTDAEIPCRLDRVFADRGVLHVVDYKSGHEPPDVDGNAQLLLGALCVAHVYGRSEIRTSIVALDFGGRWDTATLDLFDLETGRDRIHRIWCDVREASGNVRVSSHCRYCPAMAACPAYTALARWTLDAVPVVDTMSTSDVGVAWERLTQARRFVDELEKALKARIEREGEVPLPGGGVVRPVTSTRRSVDAVIAVDVLREYGFDLEPMIKRSVDIATIDKVAGDRKRDVWAALRAADAVREIQIVSYRKGK